MDNLAEKVATSVRLIGAVKYCSRTIGTAKTVCALYGVAGCPLFRGCLGIEVNGRTVGTFRIVHCTKECDKTAILPIRALCIVILILIR